MVTHYPDPATRPKRDRRRTPEQAARENAKRATGMPAGRPPIMRGAYLTLVNLKKAGCVHRHHETGELFVLISREDGTAYPILLTDLVGLTSGAVNYLHLETTAIETREKAKKVDNDARLETAAKVWGR